MAIGLKGIITSLLVVLSLIGLNNCGVEGGRLVLSKEEDLELERQLKILNKPPLKTFQTEVGDIIDCVDIYKQPAFDNPLLKNHTIQMKPSFFPKRVANEDPLAAEQLLIRFKGEECPSGTVPIRRTRKEDLLRAKSFSREAATLIGQHNAQFPGQYLVDLKEDIKTRYRGVSAYINVYNPPVGPEQFSTAQVWIENGIWQETNNIQAGWAVNPSLYGDNLSRLFTFWTGDGYKKTGCYNTLCPGFVQVDKAVFPDTPMGNISTYGGQQFEVKVMISQDSKTGDWWFSVAGAKDQEIHVGYWPESLFTNLNVDGGGDVVWGGVAKAGPNGVSPAMGNGHFPGNNACYFRDMKFLDDDYTWTRPYKGSEDLRKKTDNKNCYDIKYMGCDNGPAGCNARFGGPGGKCG